MLAVLFIFLGYLASVIIALGIAKWMHPSDRPPLVLLFIPLFNCACIPLMFLIMLLMGAEKNTYIRKLINWYND